MEAAQKALVATSDITRQQALAKVEATIPDITTRILDAVLGETVRKAVEEYVLIGESIPLLVSCHP